MLSRKQALQKAVYGRLVTHLGALSPAVAVYDHVADNAAMPFVEIGRWIDNAANTISDDISELTLTLTVWSAYEGQKEVLGILDAISDALDDQILTTETGQIVRIDRERDDTALDADGVSYTGTALYTILLQH